VNVWIIDRFSGLVRSALGSAVKFHRFVAEYVAVGGRPRCFETARRGMDNEAGSFYYL
jgi:hypothetical protein